jgi:hypothetical protein
MYDPFNTIYCFLEVFYKYSETAGLEPSKHLDLSISAMFGIRCFKPALKLMNQI